MSANTISNNKISNIVDSQVPFFVRNDHRNFVKFLEKYYEYLEQNDKVINRIKNAQRYYDIDLTEDIFAEKMYKVFLKYLPESSPVDKNLLLKHIKDFYRSKGTEKSVRFLMNILFAEFPYSIYYPKDDVLRASDGKWYVKKTLRVNDVRVNSTANSELNGVLSFVKTKIKGNNSNATALVESVDRFYENNVLIDELVISNIDGLFENGETIFARFDGPEKEEYLSANVFGGQLANVRIIKTGSLYQSGTQIPIENEGTGSGGFAVITKVTTGSVKDISVIYGGAGYRANDEVIIIAQDITGSGATANISEVQILGTAHPNSYNVMYSTINLVENELLDYGNVYTALNNSNVNTTIQNAASYWTYANTGPILTVLVLEEGSNYRVNPQITAISNTTIVSLGILGRLSVVNGGVGYEANDDIIISNVLGGYGYGAKGNVVAVNSTGAIITVGWKSIPGQYIGGSGYDPNYLPKCNIVSQNVNAYGANVIVACLLGTGANLIATNTAIGGIEQVTLVSRGLNYTTPPTLNLKSLGDGTAIVNVSAEAGTFAYPGRYLNDDGHISSYNFLQDRDYYQSFSYVIRSNRSVEEYRQAVLDLVHPSGMRMFGEYDFVNENTNVDPLVSALDAANTTYTSSSRNYWKSMNTITILYTSHGKSVSSNTYLEFDKANVENALYTIWFANTNYFKVNSHSYITSINTSNNSGNVEVFNITSINT